MRRLVPDVADEELDDLYLDLDLDPGAGPHVYMGMVASVDGAASVRGRTAPLGGEADALAYSRLRESCDVILVGATTARLEGYGPPRVRAGGRERRQARGMAPVPTIVVTTAAVSPDPTDRLFSDPERRPVVLTTEDAAPDRVGRLEAVADVVRAGRGRVDLRAGIAALADRGWRRILLEGGPSLNAQMIAEGLVDEIFLTLSPGIVGGGEPRIVEGVLADAPRPLHLVELRCHGDELLLRYRLR